MSEGILDILIPTFNRDAALIKNLQNIQNMIIHSGLQEEVGVVISDNGSEENSYTRLQHYLSNHCIIRYKIFRQETNIGVESNVLFLLDKSNAKYVMTLGDDDFFEEEYLTTAIEYLKSNKYTGIISNPYPINENGKRIGEYRDIICEDKIYDKNDIWICEKGHQLSCLIFLREGVLSAYRKDVRPNVYPFIFFLAYNIMRGEIIHITREPYAVTIIPKKNWDYSFDNLMGELSIVLDCIPFSSENVARRQLGIMIKNNAQRYCNRYTYLHPIKLYKKVKGYSVSDRTKCILLRIYFFRLLTFPFRKLCHFFNKQ